MEENVQYDKKSLRLVWGKTADFGELAKDCVAFANTFGGKIAIGIEDNSDLPPIGQHIPEDLPEKIMKRISELTMNVAVTPEISTAENQGQYIILHIYPSQSSLACTTKYLIRDHDSSRALRPEELNRLFTDKPAYCWETKVSLHIKWQNADQTKLTNFISNIRNSDRVSDFVKDKNEVEMLAYYQMIDDEEWLTNLGVLWIGKTEQRARLLYSPIVQYIKYDEDENKVQKKMWDDYSLNPQELIENSVWRWTQRNGVNGQLVTGPNGKSLFLPAAGCLNDSSLNDVDSCGYYWTSTISNGASFGGTRLRFDSEYVDGASGQRSYGFPVRPVRVP